MTPNRDSAVAGIVLAGGLSRRMGGIDKPLADLGGKPMIAHVIARLRPQVSALAVSANGDPSRFAALNLPVLTDPIAGSVGPLAGLLAGLQWAKARGMPLLISAPADTPLLPAALVNRLKEGIGAAEIAVARSRNAIHPTIALWNASLTDELAAWLHDDNHRAVREWIGSRRTTAIDFPDDDDGDPFFNVNTPADLDAALHWLRKVRVR